MKHAEAFRIMTYRCSCGHSERLWNSRDGVTPFSIPCPSCKDGMGMVHVDWQNDVFCPLYRPSAGERYFADMTRERAREFANQNADYLVSIGRIKENGRNRYADSLFDDFYGDGHSPDILEAA